MTWPYARQFESMIAIRAVLLGLAVAVAGCVSLSGGGGTPGLKAELTLSADRDTFATATEPVTFYLTLRNTGREPFVLCPNRIESQNTVRYAVVRNKNAFPMATEWGSIPVAIADHLHRDAEEYVTVAPGGSFRWTDGYYTEANVLNLVAGVNGKDGVAGRYFVRAYFDGAECPVRNASPEIMKLLLKARLVSNPVTIRLQQ